MSFPTAKELRTALNERRNQVSDIDRDGTLTDIKNHLVDCRNGFLDYVWPSFLSEGTVNAVKKYLVRHGFDVTVISLHRTMKIKF